MNRYHNFLYSLTIILVLWCCKRSEIIQSDQTEYISISLNIDDKQKNIDPQKNIIINFSGQVSYSNGDEINQSNIHNIILLKKYNPTGENVIFTNDISENKTQIKINLNTLVYDTTYYLKIDGTKLKGRKGEKIKSKEVYFTTKSNSSKKLEITDPLYKHQWYLKNTGQYNGTVGIDIKIEPVWKQGYTGKGIDIAILDDPLAISESTAHEDLKENQNFAQSHNYATYNDEIHGINVAGIIAASANNLGIRGIAYESKLYTYGILSEGSLVSMSAVVDALKRINQNPQIAVINNSWGNDEDILIDAAYRKNLEKGLETGFLGKGVAHVKSAGNDGFSINSTLEGGNNYYGFILVNSLDYNGANTSREFTKERLPNGKSVLFSGIAWLTSIGSNLWVSAPSYRMMTTTKQYGYNLRPVKYEDSFGATSGAAPVVTGIVALMREANPNLTWRDVKLILAEIAIKNDPTHIGWQQGHAKKNNAAAQFEFNHNYGFGMVNAQKAIELSKKWRNLPPMKTEIFHSANLNIAIDSSTKENTINIKNSTIQFIESVVVELDLDKKTMIEKTNNFDIKLIKNKLKSHLYMEGKSFEFDDTSYYNKDKITLKLLTNAHLGDRANGQWKMTIKDTDIFVKLKGWRLIIRGH